VYASPHHCHSAQSRLNTIKEGNFFVKYGRMVSLECSYPSPVFLFTHLQSSLPMFV
jgi:hypothetical protein